MNPLDMFMRVLQNYCMYHSFEDLGLLLEGLDFDEVLPYVTAAFGEGTPEYLAFVDYYNPTPVVFEVQSR